MSTYVIISIALIGFAAVVIGAAILGCSAIIAATLSRNNSRGSSFGPIGVVVLLGIAAGFTACALLGSAVMLGSWPLKFHGRERPWQEFTVFSDLGWQDTGVTLREGQQFQVQYVSGRWTYWSGTLAPFDGNGDNYICGRAECCEPLPGERKGALIGKIGNEVFLIGNGGTFTAGSRGRLLLRMNDCDGSFSDNKGAIQVRIVP